MIRSLSDHRSVRARPAGDVGGPEGLQSYQLVGRVLPCLGYHGYRGSGPGPGEVALKTASTSKEGSRRETFPMTKLVEDVRKHTSAGPLRAGNWDEGYLDLTPSNY